MELDILQIELLDFDRPVKFSVELTNLEVTLSRSFTKGSSPLNIDFWIMEKNVKKRLMKQHCNHAWKYYDVKELFLTLKEMKKEKLSKKEKEIVDQGIGLGV